MTTRYFRPADDMPRIYLYRDPVDFRKASAGLAAIVEREIGHNPFDGGLYAFTNKNHIVLEQGKRINLLEEYLRLATVQKFGASSEKLAFQSDLFDEAEIEVALSELEEQLPEEDRVRPRKKKRKRGFSDKLQRVQIHLALTDEEKAGATKTFFTKVKEELEFIPAQVKVLEYWQEKAVFNSGGEDVIVAAQRPAHPLGKCFASPALLAYIIASKYADGLPLYRLEGMLTRYGGDISRSNMANWIVRLQDVFQPLINLIREVQLEGNYLQADETRIQVLKEAGKTAQSDKWMWLIRGGPPDKQSVLFEYDPSRAGAVAERLLDGFGGVLQADTSHGARASATCYSLVETAKANGLEPYAYLQHVLAHIAAADTVEKLEALLPWNMEVQD